MSKKVFNVFSILCFALVLCFIGCTELINPKTETDINLNIDLSKIIKSTRNTEETQSSVSLGENPTIKVAIYDAKKYNATTNSTDNLDLITEAQAKIVNNEAKVKLNNIPVGIDAIVFAELSFSNGNSTEVMYAGNSGVFKVKASDNKVSLVLMKVGNSETYPDDSNTSYKILSWDDLVNKINSLSDYITTTEFVITEELTATSTITVSKPVKIISDKEVKITRGSEFSGEFFYIDTGSLELGSNEYKIILDGNNINAAYPLILSSGNGLTLTNCTLQSNTLNNTAPGFGNGGAVYVSGGTFTMNNSSIIDCSANVNGGAVYITDGGIFTMNDDASISNCNATNSGGGVYVTGKDNPCTFKMLDNATIIGCSAVNGGAVYITDGGIFTMNDDASIRNCNATNSGGGVWMNRGSSFTMFGGKIDCCNSDSEGGGVYVTDSSNPCTFKMLDNATITSCIAKNGGGIYLYGKLTMNGGTISHNTATESGGGVYLSDSTSSFTMNGGAYVDSSNDVYLANEATVTVAGDLTYCGIVATITPFEYNVGTQVLTAESGETLEKYVGMFALTSSADSTTYEIDSNGKLALVSQTYAAGLTCEVDSDDTVTLYISNANGLATFRDIVNGSFTENIIVQYKFNSNSTHEFSADKKYQNVNAVLESDINLSGDWTPIGVYSNETTSAKPYSGTFDGKGKTITFDYITHDDANMYSSGLFQMLAGTVKNLIIDGSISRTDAGYIGGITGYLDGGTIENCVNNATITNSASNGTGGIVGYVGTGGGTIQNCINLVSVTGGNSVGGIVGATGVISGTSNVSISKCINMGEIFGTSNVSGILGTANTSAISISDCMNIGKILANNTSEPAYVSGITTPSEAFTVSSCINVGEVSATNETYANSGAISSIPENGKYTNNYYDSTVNPIVVDSSTPYITGKSTSELIGSSSNLLLEGITAENWSFADGRYPLPDIAGNIPGDEDGVIWSAVLKAATPKSTSTSGGGIDGTIQSLSDLSVYYDSANECYSLTTGEYIFGKDLELDRPLYILSGNQVTIRSNTNVTIKSSFSYDNLVYIDRQDEDNYGTLTLGSGDGVLTLKHENSIYPTIASYGELTLNNNCAITGSNYCAINIYNGNFYMNGGEIYGNKYSGPNIQSSSVNLLFTDDSINSSSAEFYGGKIYYNETNTSGGAIAYIGNAMPYIVLTGIEIYNNKANISGGGIYSNTANLYVNSESRIYNNYVNGSNQGASIFVTEVGGSYFYLDNYPKNIPYTEDIGQ